MYRVENFTQVLAAFRTVILLIVSKLKIKLEPPKRKSNRNKATRVNGIDIQGPLPPPPPPPPAPAPDPPAASSAGAPPPPPGPPPPPPPPGGGGGLAAQLAAAKLKKAETGLTPGGPPQPPAPSGPPKMDFASELQNRIRKRSAMNNE